MYASPTTRESFAMARAPVTHIIANRQPAARNLANRGREVGGEPHPTDARSRMYGRRKFALAQSPLEVGEVGARALAKRVPAPDARIQVEQLRPTIARVSLELNFDESAVAQGGQHAGGGRLECRIVDRIDERACATEVHRKLADAAGHNPRQRSARDTQRSN